jgi:hypothetical protein
MITKGRLGKIREAFKRAGPPPAPGFPVKGIPARDLQNGMTLVAMPDDWMDVRPDGNGHWPAISEFQRLEKGEGGVPCVYWVTDEPEPWNGYWCFPDTVITVAVKAGK